MMKIFTSPQLPYVPLFPLTLALSVLLVGCVSLPPPTAELATAQQALARAVETDAEQYADEALTRTRRLLEQAQAALAEGQNRQAREFAALALVSAELAGVQSQHVKVLLELEQRRRQIAELRSRLQREELP